MREEINKLNTDFNDKHNSNYLFVDKIIQFIHKINPSELHINSNTETDIILVLLEKSYSNKQLE